MDMLIVCVAALIASALTLFSGFGMGTLLMPVFEPQCQASRLRRRLEC